MMPRCAALNVLPSGLLLLALLIGVAPAQQAAPSSPVPPAAAPATPAGSVPARPGNAARPAGEGAFPAPGAPTDHEKAGACVEGSEQACMGLTREGKDGKERRILVIRTGTSDDTGIYAICQPPEGSAEDAPNIGVFSESGPGGIRIVIDKNLIEVPLAVVTQRPPREGEKGSDGRVEASSGTARFLDDVPEGKTDRLSLCGVEARPQPVPDSVRVTQGRTHLTGQSLVYDEKDGIARIDGPIKFERADQEDPLAGRSQRIEINVDTEATVLVGEVELRSKGGRVSRASRVEYDDQANTARLYATAEQPAESVKGTDVLRVTEGVIVYNLDLNEVYADADGAGNISGEFQDEGDEEAAPTPPSQQR